VKNQRVSRAAGVLLLVVVGRRCRT